MAIDKKTGKKYDHPILDDKTIAYATVTKTFLDDMPNRSSKSIRIYLYFMKCVNYPIWGQTLEKSHSAITEGTGIKDPSTISSAVMELIQSGWIGEIKHQHDDSNIYTVNVKPVINLDLVKSEMKRREKMSLLKKKSLRNRDLETNRFLPNTADGNIPTPIEDGCVPSTEDGNVPATADGSVPSHLKNSSKNKNKNNGELRPHAPSSSLETGKDEDLLEGKDDEEKLDNRSLSEMKTYVLTKNYKTIRKCSHCKIEIVLEADHKDITYYDKVYFHNSCLKEKLTSKKKGKLSDEEVTNVITASRDETEKHAFVVSAKNQVVEFLKDKYDAKVVSKHIHTKLSNMYSGTLNGNDIQIYPDHLLDILQRYESDHLKALGIKKIEAGEPAINYVLGIALRNHNEYMNGLEKAKVDQEQTMAYLANRTDYSKLLPVPIERVDRLADLVGDEEY